MIILRQRAYALTVDGGGKSISAVKQDWVNAGQQGSFTDFYKNSMSNTNSTIRANEAAAASNRSLRKKVGNLYQEEVSQIAKNANQKGYRAGLKAGAKNVGVLGGIKNTWASGAKGKAGLIATGAGLLGTGALAVKGLTSQKQSA